MRKNVSAAGIEWGKDIFICGSCSWIVFDITDEKSKRRAAEKKKGLSKAILNTSVMKIGPVETSVETLGDLILNTMYEIYGHSGISRCVITADRVRTKKLRLILKRRQEKLKNVAGASIQVKKDVEKTKMTKKGEKTPWKKVQLKNI